MRPKSTEGSAGKAAVNRRPKSAKEYRLSLFAVGVRERIRSGLENRPDCCMERFFSYLCPDDSPVRGLFALLHVKTATFKCRGKGARMLRELSAHGPATGSYLLFIETTRYGRGFLVSVFDMGFSRPSREYGYLGACAFLFRKRRPGYTDRRLSVASLLSVSSWSKLPPVLFFFRGRQCGMPDQFKISSTAAAKAPPPVFFLRSPAATDRNFVIFAHRTNQ